MDASAEPGRIQRESSRVCKVCGGPNHYGCGCEAKRQAKAMVEIENIHKDEQPASGTDDILEDILSPEGIIAEHEAFKKMAKDIKVMAEGFETMCVCLYDTNNLLKIIAGDLITIRKFLTKEDEVKDAGKNNN